MKSISADAYYFKQPEPYQGCLLALKEIILNVSPHIGHRRMFQIPFFFYKDKKLCFLWVHRKKLLLGFVEDKNIYKKVPGQRRKSKMTMLEIDPNADLPMKKILPALQKLIVRYDKYEAISDKKK